MLFRTLTLVSTALSTLAPAALAEQRPHHTVDNQELFTLRTTHPEAVALLDAGDAALERGNVTQALDAFQGAARLAPKSRLAARRECQGLALLGRRVEAMEACRRAVGAGASPLDFRASVLAITSGTTDPTSQELSDARVMAATAMRQLPAEPWGYAAQCDIFARIADEASVSACNDRLALMDPTHYEVKRGLSRQGGASLVGFALGWGAIVLAGLGTLLHAARRPWRAAFRRAGAAGVVAFAALLTSSPARAAEPPTSPRAASPAASEASASPAASESPDEEGVANRWPVNDEDPPGSVPTPAQRDSDPLEYGYFLIDLTHKAGAAEAATDYKKAIAYYLALAKAVPDEAVAFSKLCELEEALHESAKALEACRVALTLHGVKAGDFARYGRLLVSQDGPFTAADDRAVRVVIAHLKSEGAAPDLVQSIECPLSLRAQDPKIIERCAVSYEKENAQSQQAITYRWALAVTRGDDSLASSLLGRAKAAGVEPSGIRQMEKAMSDARLARYERLFRNWKLLFGVLAALGLVSVTWGAKALRRAAARRTTGTATT